jgi:hypothetical protein
MSDGTINFPERVAHPATPASGRTKIYIYDDGLTSEPYYKLDNGLEIPMRTIPSFFGTGFQFVESLGVSTTSSTVFQQKLRLTTATLLSGQYMINWSADVGGGSDKEVQFRVQLNDVTDLSNTDFRIKKGDASDTDFYIPMGGHAIKTLSGINTIDIDYRQQNSTAAIKNARLTIWRIS